MSNIESFVIANNLQPADAILLTKKFFGMLNHFAVYIGRHPQSNIPMFAANYTSGVQLISSEEAEVFLEKLEPTKIERFYGTYHQRKEAVRRALSKIGDKTYNLIFNNCEHYKNFVHFSQKYSPQVENAGKVAMISGGITAIAGATSGNNKALGWGLLIFALGAIATNAAKQEE